MPKAISISTDSAPVLAMAPAPEVSSRYTFIPTRDIVAGLQRTGWVFDGGTARVTRRPERQQYALHVLRFSHPSLPEIAEGTRPQAVLVNSHGGSSSFRLALGAFRIACANGLVIQSADCGTVRLRHTGLTLSEVLSATDHLLEQAPKVIARVREWSRIELSTEKQEQLAGRARRLRWDVATHAVPVDAILRSRRQADTGNDLWRVFNRVQESLIRGGVPVARYDKPVVRLARPLTSPQAQLEINQGLWELAEEVAFAS